MRRAETIWRDHAESGEMALIGRWNKHNELGAQFPIPALRIAYAASGTNPAACVLRNDEPSSSMTISVHAGVFPPKRALSGRPH